jgi:membrane-bound ClpP family serine protease
MERLFAWYYLIFEIPLIVGIILVIGAGYGMSSDTDVEVDADVDAEAEAEIDGDGIEDSMVIKVLSVLGVGKCPLSIVVMSASLVFGGTGLILNELVQTKWLVPISIGGAFFSMVFFTRLLASIVSKIIPGTSTSVVSKYHLDGTTGKAVTKITTKFGMAHVLDQHATLHKIKCRTYSGELALGTPILVVEHKTDGFFYVEKDPQQEEE